MTTSNVCQPVATMRDPYIFAIAQHWARVYSVGPTLAMLGNGYYSPDSFKGEGPAARSRRCQLYLDADKAPDMLRASLTRSQRKILASDMLTIRRWCDHLAGLHKVSCPCS
jgi:hypothetical protein